MEFYPLIPTQIGILPFIQKVCYPLTLCISSILKGHVRTQAFSFQEALIIYWLPQTLIQLQGYRLMEAMMVTYREHLPCRNEDIVLLSIKNVFHTRGALA